MRVALFFLAFAPLATAVEVTDAVRNDRVAVVEITIQPGESETRMGGNPAILVYFTDGSLAIRAGGGRPSVTNVKRGEAVFVEPQERTVKNTGPSPVHFARIEFKGGGLAETWGTTGLSPNYKLLFENQYTRVYDIRIPAGTKEPQHTHHDRIVVCLSGAELKHLMPDGREEPSTLKTGEIVWRRGATHIGQNLGKTDLWVIAVEPK